MFRVPTNSLPRVKQELLRESRTQPKMYIYIENYHYDYDIHAIIYEVQTGIQNDNDVIISTTNVRYSQLEKMDNILRQTKDLKIIPKFPPKKWFGNTNPTFLQKRKNDLQNYLKLLTQNHNIQETKEFCEVFH